MSERSIVYVFIVAALICFSILSLFLFPFQQHEDRFPPEEDQYSEYSGSRSTRILMDGDFDDWTSIEELYSDGSGDAEEGRVDFQRMKMANDERFIFIYIETGKEITLQEENKISLCIDTDNDPATGKQLNGIGVDLEWGFGERSGIFRKDDDMSFSVRHSDIGLVTAPTVSSDRFEIAIERNAEVGSFPMFINSSFHILVHEKDDGKDMIPDSYDRITYNINESPLLPISKIDIGREVNVDLRVMSFNVLRDDIFDEEKFSSYQRILLSIDPDIICFQEIYDHSAVQTHELVEKMFPSNLTNVWYSSKIDPDIVIISRFPVISKYAIDTNGAFLLDTTGSAKDRLLIIGAHLPSGDKNSARQTEINEIMDFIYDMKTTGGPMNISKDTPFIILGDMNLVGYAEQYSTFLSGSRNNTPDWDDTELSDLKPRHTGSNMFYTWFNKNSTYSPGRLDYIFYSDSVLVAEKGFVLFTYNMSTEDLYENTLNKYDSITASDHLPSVADFQFKI